MSKSTTGCRYPGDELHRRQSGDAGGEEELELGLVAAESPTDRAESADAAHPSMVKLDPSYAGGAPRRKTNPGGRGRGGACFCDTIAPRIA